MLNIDKFKLKWYSSYKVKKYRETILSTLSLNKKTNIFFVFGCQRSGTSIVQKLIGLSPRVKFYGEGDLPYFYSEDSSKHHRIKTDKEINDLLKDEALKYITLKPLYESHHADSLISKVSDSKGVWVFRNYFDVIDSHLHYYNHNIIEYVSPLFTNDNNNWLNEYIPDNIQSFINRYSIDDISDADAYGLFWIARNSLYNEVLNNKNILCINYEALVKNPDTQIKRMCEFLSIPFYSFYSKAIRNNAVSKKISFKLNPDIENKCEEIYYKLLKSVA